jgi:hypothetical protein
MNCGGTVGGDFGLHTAEQIGTCPPAPKQLSVNIAGQVLASAEFV